MTSRTASADEASRKFDPSHALHYVPRHAGVVLDVGCNVGETLGDLRDRGMQMIGVDINPDAVATAAARFADHPNVRIAHASADALPVESSSVDVVLCLETLEHVPPSARAAAVQEMHRVLRAGGLLLLSTPYAGMFDWLDPENMRFHAQWLYRPVSQLIGGAGKERGYRGQKHGVVPHHHFTLGELRRLLGGAFELRHVRYRGCLAFPLMSWLLWPMYRAGAIHTPVAQLMLRAQALDAAIDWGPSWAFNVLLTAQKVATGT